ncbi:hypothetical protein [Enterobacter asburiae]|uniref:hypothetical protein n=1 Tax=Enterobacter asburiae TaxID=61645 RepID=UPI003F54E5D1
MRTSKTKPMIVSMPGYPIIFCIPQPRMTIEQYAQMTNQGIRAVQQQADAGKFIIAKGKYGKNREINMVAEFLKEYRDAQEALKESA